MRAPVAIVCALLVSAGSARAERRAVAVIDLSGETPAEALAKGLNYVLSDHLDLQRLPNTKFEIVLYGEFLDEDRPYLERAKLAKQAADDALAQLDYRRAAAEAKTGMDALASVMPVPDVLGLYAELAFADGQAQLGQRKPNDASRSFALAHQLDATKAPDPTRYEPAIIAAYNRAANKKVVPATIEVKGDGRVWIDGVEEGPANAKFQTTEGVHLVQLSGPDRETRGEQVTVPQTEPTNIAPAPATEELLIRRARSTLKTARDVTARAYALKHLAELLKVDDAVLILRDGNKLVVQTWRSKAGFSRLVEHGNEKPIDLLTPLAPPRKLEARSEPPPPPPPIVIGKPWYKKNWVRVSAASTVVAAVVSAILYANRGQIMTWNPNIQQK